MMLRLKIVNEIESSTPDKKRIDQRQQQKMIRYLNCQNDR